MICVGRPSRPPVRQARRCGCVRQPGRHEVAPVSPGLGPGAPAPTRGVDLAGRRLDWRVRYGQTRADAFMDAVAVAMAHPHVQTTSPSVRSMVTDLVICLQRQPPSSTWVGSMVTVRLWSQFGRRPHGRRGRGLGHLATPLVVTCYGNG